MDEGGFKGWCSAHVLILLVFLLTTCSREEPREMGTMDGVKENGVTKIRLLPPKEGNPRNSEGDFIQLRDGRILFIYTHYYAGQGGDNDPAYLAARYSTDGGRSWTPEDVKVLENEGGMNIMSVSLLRLAGGEIALFYLRKNSTEDDRPVMRLSSDEARTWSKPVEIIPEEEIGYYVLNNDRVVQLPDGRLIAPVALHHAPGWEGTTPFGHAMCYLSDDSGGTWRRSRTVLTTPKTAEGEPVHLQEPGVVVLKDGRLMMFMRTSSGSQYLSYSSDQGENWSPPLPSSIRSPRSPASIETDSQDGRSAAGVERQLRARPCRRRTADTPQRSHFSRRGPNLGEHEGSGGRSGRVVLLYGHRVRRRPGAAGPLRRAERNQWSGPDPDHLVRGGLVVPVSGRRRLVLSGNPRADVPVVMHR